MDRSATLTRTSIGLPHERDPQALAGSVTVGTGDTLYVEQRGSGPPVVLVHSNFASLRMWDPQIPALAEQFEVIAYDVCGFGRSPLVAGRHTDQGDLYALLQKLGIPVRQGPYRPRARNMR